MTENEISKLIYDVSFKIHRKLGPGLFESVYEEIMFYELKKLGLLVERQKPVPLIWEEIKMEAGFRADLFLEKSVIIEIKSVEALNPIHHTQVVTYLKLLNCHLGILINFNTLYLKDGIKRIVNKLDERTNSKIILPHRNPDAPQ